MEKKDEGSNTSNLASTVQGQKNLAAMQGFGPKPVGFGGKDAESPLRNRKKHPKKWLTPPKIPTSFSEDIANRLFDEGDQNEVVRKRGQTWVVYDDSTGVETGSYRDRKTAWAKQRIRRTQEKLRKAQNAKTHRRKKPKARARHEHYDFAVQVARSLLNENMLSYMFEQDPSKTGDSSTWQELISKVSNKTLQSDPKLKRLMDLVQKAKSKLLNKAIGQVKNTLQATKHFTVEDVRAGRSETGDIAVQFTVQMQDNGTAIPLGLEIQNNKPLITFPGNSRTELNTMANEESKLLRAELMHAQETALDGLDDVANAAHKRDAYLHDTQKKLDKIVSGLVPMQIALLKNLLKAKYKGMT